MESLICLPNPNEEMNNSKSFDNLVSMWSRRHTKLVKHHAQDSTPKIKSNAKISSDVGLNASIPHKHMSIPLPIQTVCDIPELMINIYSFLTASDRVRLGEVDAQFYLDAGCGKIVGICGENVLAFDDALKVVKNWIYYEGSPESWRAEGVDLKPPGEFALKDFDDSWRYWDFSIKSMDLT